MKIGLRNSLVFFIRDRKQAPEAAASAEAPAEAASAAEAAEAAASGAVPGAAALEAGDSRVCAK